MMVLLTAYYVFISSPLLFLLTAPFYVFILGTVCYILPVVYSFLQ